MESPIKSVFREAQWQVWWLDAIKKRKKKEKGKQKWLSWTITIIISTSLASDLLPLQLQNCYCQTPAQKKQRTTTNRKFLDKNVLKNYGSVSEVPVKRFYTNSLPTSKKTSAILFHQPSAPDTALKLPFFALLTIWTLSTKWRQNLCSTFTGSFRHLWLSIFSLFFTVSKLSLPSALPHSGGFSHIFWTEISVLLKAILLPLLLPCLNWHSTQC